MVGPDGPPVAESELCPGTASGQLFHLDPGENLQLVGAGPAQPVADVQAGVAVGFPGKECGRTDIVGDEQVGDEFAGAGRGDPFGRVPEFVQAFQAALELRRMLRICGELDMAGGTQPVCA